MSFNWATVNPFAKADRGQLDGVANPNSGNNTGNAGGTGKPNDKSMALPPDNSGSRKEGSESNDPLEHLATLWEPNKDKDGKPIPQDTGPKSYMPALDQKKLEEMVGKMNFADGITKEEMEAIKAGGDDAVGAFANMLNRAGRKSFLTAFQASSRMAEQGLTAAQQRMMEDLAPKFRDMMVDEGLSNDLGIADNPMFQPLVKSVKAQILQKFPKATPNEVRSYLKQYFDGLKNEFGKADKNKNQNTTTEADKLRTGANDADFLAWLGDEATSGSSMFGNAGSSEDSDLQT